MPNGLVSLNFCILRVAHKFPVVNVYEMFLHFLDVTLNHLRPPLGRMGPGVTTAKQQAIG